MRLIGLIAAAAIFGGCKSDNNVETYVPQAELILADVSGTYYAGGVAMPRTHLLLEQTRLPGAGSPPQYLDPDFTPTSGCVVSRYDSSATPYPNPDQAVGPATYTGFAANLLALDAKTVNVYPPPIPMAINCTRDINPYFACVFGGAGGPEKIAGDAPISVAFPAVPMAAYGAACPGCTCDPQMVPDGAGGMTTVCEQHPLADGAHVTEDLGPGGGYSALTLVALPALAADNQKFVRITVGSGDVATLADVVLDGTADVSIGWNCSPSPSDKVPSGVMCPAASGANSGMIGLFAISSTRTRDLFQPGVGYSVVQCFDAIDDPRGTLTIKKEAIQVLLGGALNGSALLAATRLIVYPSTSQDHSVYLAEGRGQFALINRPGAVDIDMAMPIDFATTD